MINELVTRYSKPVPRYTSYPTAPQFHSGIDNAAYRDWLGAVPLEAALSLYIHVPFCDRLCWFCGCHTKQVLRYDPIAAYLPSVLREIDTVSSLLDGRGTTVALHLGGGSPSMLKPDDLLRLSRKVRDVFGIAASFEFSIEIDPNDMTADRYDGLAEAGVTRISVGLQDFDPRVQEAINRLQTFEQTKAVVDGMRSRSVSSVNLDILYGLPYQSAASVEQTVMQALSMNPDRIALFGYAHVPWMKPHQKLIDEAVLPSPGERLEQSQAAAERLLSAGYLPIGIDHFALPSDRLAKASHAGTLHRNFQGYTTDSASVLLGLGASSIGGLPMGYVQNATATGEYIRRIAADGLAVSRGIRLSGEDRPRAWVIERLMCDFAVSFAELKSKFGTAADNVVGEMMAFARKDTDALVSLEAGVFSLTERGKPFVRVVASRFDAYFTSGTGKHSIAV